MKEGDKNPVLNLAEVEAYSHSGALLQPVDVTLRSPREDGEVWEWEASTCTDGVFDNGCSSRGGTDPHLVIDYGKKLEIALIRVVNRKDCCSDRIAGATVSVTTDREGRQVHWSSTFQGTQPTYTFHAQGHVPVLPWVEVKYVGLGAGMCADLDGKVPQYYEYATWADPTTANGTTSSLCQVRRAPFCPFTMPLESAISLPTITLARTHTERETVYTAVPCTASRNPTSLWLAY